MSRSQPPDTAVRAKPKRRSPAVGPRAQFSIVGIGASAGGLDACKVLIGALPPKTGMAFILVLHLDPTHESMMVDLLTGHTPLIVKEAADGLPVEPEHLYVIPPGAFLSVRAGALHLSRPKQKHGARLPFDFLLDSLAEDCAARAIGVVLSGTGNDGSLGLKTLKAAGGMVFVQDPEDARFDGMPRSAIATGAVDRVLPLALIAGALLDPKQGRSAVSSRVSPEHGVEGSDLDAIVELLRRETDHDFSAYKRGTLQRRVERRMALADIRTGDMSRYLTVLRNTPGERDLLAKDLHIHVTAFFRDPGVFALLARETIPSLLDAAAKDGSVRIWIAGCSTGEETYSLAMLFREAITAAKLDIKLQIFASDVDEEAVTKARDGLYRKAIESEVSPERLSRFFYREDHGYRVSPDLRSLVVFTVQDVLVDPPFARLDMVSCRNLLIYLGSDAQEKLIATFNFALNEGGILLLGTAETVGRAEDRFDIVAKAERLYRRIGRGRSTDVRFVATGADGLNPGLRSRDRSKLRLAGLSDVCRRMVLDSFAPAAVLINGRNECVYHLGPTDTFLSVPAGPANHDILEMVRAGARSQLNSAIVRARREAGSVVISGASRMCGGVAVPFDIVARAAPDEDLVLVRFVDTPVAPRRHLSDGEMTRVAELERELETTRAELHDVIRDLETSGEDQKAVNEEALSFNEEYQSTNEELITSKEELQAFNEELTALNGQLQETLERQRTTSNDLQNVLFSTNVATLFLDGNLNIRFFTPATKALFAVIPGDIGRPLADLHSLASDERLPDDVRTVLRSNEPIEREIEGRGGIWFIRRILPYRSHDGSVEGVVITFTDITERKRDAVALEAAKRQAEQATVAKSRFLAAASHDLRQPLQTLSLIHGLLAKTVEGEGAHRLVNGLADTLSAMGGMLNTLLDVNQIEAGIVRPDMVRFPIIDILDRLRDEFAYHAEAHNLSLRVAACSLFVLSDRHLLEQMIRNLLSNALKYTTRGKVVLGCRRRPGGVLSIEIWDTGTGIPDRDLQAIFAEYHQLENSARERSRGLGLGLSIVQSLGKLLGHDVHVRSVAGKGSVFAVDVALADKTTAPPAVDPHRDTGGSPGRAGDILVIEDDVDIRELLALVLTSEGHRVTTATDGASALERVAKHNVRPDLILADYNLPNGMTGLEAAARIQTRLMRPIPVVVLTGDISTETLRTIADQDCVKLDKPVRSEDLTRLVQKLLSEQSQSGGARPTERVDRSGDGEPPIVFIVDDEDDVRTALRALFEAEGHVVEDYPDSEGFLEAYRRDREGCLLVDACLPGISGLELLERLRGADHALPAIMITGRSDVAMAVRAMKVGATDFIEKPAAPHTLLDCVRRALERSRDVNKRLAWSKDAASHLDALTPRQRQIMNLVLSGNPSKNIAADLGISQRTVENHRASIMKKTGSKSLPALARLVLAAGPIVVDRPVLQD